ncbi:MAG TPA: hypothetical protein VKB02_18270 [Pyrinomonadaceae bacterium]|nr:hypothetical protein [Pyrinomonadaceae bacterium]
MVRKMFLLVMLGTFLAIGGFWALKAQDPAPQNQNQNENSSRAPVTAGQTNQVDLSGTYSGTFVGCEAAGFSGDTTLTITGNQFTTADGKTGRVIASRTRGYTAVAMQMSGAGSPVVSFRGKKSGNKLTLNPIAGSTQQCTFTTSRSAANRGTTTPTGTEVANPSQSPRPSPSPGASPSPEASPNPSPDASPSPGGSPMPTPSPTEPTPSPSPGGSPIPSPSPSPRW